MSPDRVVVGSDNPRTAELLKILYDPFTEPRAHDHYGRASAELTKYAANAMLAKRISFMKRTFQSCRACRRGHREGAPGHRIGSSNSLRLHLPRLRDCGSCFPKDVQALIRSAHEHGFEARLLSAVQEVNYRQKQTLYRKIQSFFGDRLASQRSLSGGWPSSPTQTTFAKRQVSR